MRKKTKKTRHDRIVHKNNDKRTEFTGKRGKSILSG